MRLFASANLTYGIAGALADVKMMLRLMPANGTDLPVALCVMSVLIRIRVGNRPYLPATVARCIAVVVIRVTQRRAVGKGVGSLFTATAGHGINGGGRTGRGRQ